MPLPKFPIQTKVSQGEDASPQIPRPNNRTQSCQAGLPKFPIQTTVHNLAKQVSPNSPSKQPYTILPSRSPQIPHPNNRTQSCQAGLPKFPIQTTVHNLAKQVSSIMYGDTQQLTSSKQCLHKGQYPPNISIQLELSQHGKPSSLPTDGA